MLLLMHHSLVTVAAGCLLEHWLMSVKALPPLTPNIFSVVFWQWSLQRSCCREAGIAPNLYFGITSRIPRGVSKNQGPFRALLIRTPTTRITHTLSVPLRSPLAHVHYSLPAANWAKACRGANFLEKGPLHKSNSHIGTRDHAKGICVQGGLSGTTKHVNASIYLFW